MTQSDPLLSRFAGLRDRLSAVLEGESGVYERLGDPENASRLSNARRVLGADRFRIVVLGEMKRGKSTLINALLGEELLPSEQSIPCTAIPITVRHGEEKHGVCYRSDGTSTKPFEFPDEIDGFKDAVTLSDKPQEFERAELFANVSLLSNGVEILDTAGLNEDARRSDATWRQAEGADAVILVLDIEKVGMQSDREDLGRILEFSHDPMSVFVVWNRIDRVRGDGEGIPERTMRAAFGMTDPLGIPRRNIAFVSGVEALKARLQDDPEKLGASGMPEFEASLNEFLMTERSSSKLLKPLNTADQAIDDAMLSVLIGRVDMLIGPAQALKGIAKEASELRLKAKRVREKLRLRIGQAADTLSDGVAEAAETYAEDHREGIDSAVSNQHLTTRDAIFRTRSSVRKLVDAAEAWLARHAGAWESDRLDPLVGGYRSAMQQHVNEAFGELGYISAAMIGLESEASIEADRLDHSDTLLGFGSEYPLDTQALAQPLTSIDQDGVPDDSPIAGIGVGALVGGGVGLWLAAIFTPQAVIVIIAAVLAGMVFGGKTAAGVLKGRTIEAILDALREHTPLLKSKLRARVESGCKKVERSVLDSIDRAIGAIEKSALAIQERAEVEQRHADEHRQMTDSLRAQLRDHIAELAELRREVEDLGRSRRQAEAAGRQVEPKIIVEGAAESAVQQELGSDASNSLAEIRAKLGAEGWATLSEVERYYRKTGKWDPGMMVTIGQIWAEWLGVKDSDSPKQWPVFWSVIAVAVVYRKMDSNPPILEDVRKMYQDIALFTELARVFIMITGDESDISYFVDPEGTRKLAENNFVKAYERAYNKFTATPSDGEMGVGTIDQR